MPHSSQTLSFVDAQRVSFELVHEVRLEAPQRGDKVNVPSKGRDHPRRCGEHRRCPCIAYYNPGIIPTCAGSTQGRGAWWPLSWDHPRRCGEHSTVPFGATVRRGSSPHVRGARFMDRDNVHEEGIIPACAGSTLLELQNLLLYGDHPRMCGEHIEPTWYAVAVSGSSPHVRGALQPLGAKALVRGIIPACAGSTRSESCCPRRQRDHPRMCGEHESWFEYTAKTTGSSPHVRGAPHAQLAHAVLLGIIPACAGSTEWKMGHWPYDRDHPRMCGEHKLNDRIRIGVQGSSPHVRGARTHPFQRLAQAGIISACAGSTRPRT